MTDIKKVLKNIWKCQLVHTFVYSLILALIIECLNRRSISGLVYPFLHPVIFIYNTMIIMTSMAVALFFKRRIFTYCVIAFIWLAASVTNFIILSTRKTPFTAMDFYLIKDARKIAGLYVNAVQVLLIALIIVICIIGLVWLWRKAPVVKTITDRKKWSIKTAICICALFLITGITGKIMIASGSIESHYGNLAQAYEKYGFAYCFVNSVIDHGIKRTAEYSDEYMASFKNSLETVESRASEKTPNVIYVQLESFFDPSHVQGISLSENPVPNFQKLVSEYSSGYLSVPVFGAGTCNTEFEVQTGFNIDDFGPGEYPYRTIMKSNVCESVAYDLKNLGYSTHAIHNNSGTFYGRNVVYSNLGYDTFTPIEYMDGIERTPTGWAKDKILTNEIKKALDSTEGMDYVFTVSVQGHGDYPSDYTDGEGSQIKVSNFPVVSEEQSFEYYVNQLKEMDDFVGELINMLSERDEKTVVVFYGDHLPPFDFTEDMLSNKDKYKTQYVIWDNFGMEKQDEDIQAYQLSANVLAQIGISEGNVMKFHQKRQQMSDADYLKNLKILEYDILYGNRDIYGGESPYKQTDIKIGIDDITISDVYNYNNDVFIEGENYTDYSCVLINGKQHVCEKISDRLLKVKNAVVKESDVIVVVQKGDNKAELGRTIFIVK